MHRNSVPAITLIRETSPRKRISKEWISFILFYRCMNSWILFPFFWRAMSR